MILSDSTDKLKELDKQEARDIHIYSSLFILLLKISVIVPSGHMSQDKLSTYQSNHLKRSAVN